MALVGLERCKVSGRSSHFSVSVAPGRSSGEIYVRVGFFHLLEYIEILLEEKLQYCNKTAFVVICHLPPPKSSPLE